MISFKLPSPHTRILCRGFETQLRSALWRGPISLGFGSGAHWFQKNRCKSYAHFGMQIRMGLQVIGLFRGGSGVSGKFEVGAQP
jgi:hypothetical protein